MEWFKRSIGLKIVLLTALLVLFVPILRLRAIRQLEGYEINFYNTKAPYDYDPNPQFGLSRERQLEVARKYPVDAAAQLTVDLTTYRYGQLGPEPTPLRYTNRQIQQTTEDYIGRYPRLVRQFPNDINVRRQWLRDAVRGELKIESDAQYLTYYPKGGIGFYANGKPIPRRIFISQKQREAALQGALAGEKIEPDNAFWPWMTAAFNFSLRRDAQALMALQRAAKCTRFDDGIKDQVRRSVQVMHRNQYSDWEDDWSVVASVLMPHLGQIRETSRAAMWQARLAQKSGDTARAIQIANVVQNAGLPISRTSDLVITRMVGEAICAISWKMTLDDVGIKIPKFTGEFDSEKRNKERHSIVALYAKYVSKQGYADYGLRAVQFQRQFNAIDMRAASIKPDFDGVTQKSKSIKQFHWLLSRLITIVVISALVWIVAWVITCRSSLEKTVLSRSMVKWAAFCIGVTVAILLVGSSELAKEVYEKDFFNDSVNEEIKARQNLNYWLNIALILTSVLPVFIASYSSGFAKWDGRFSSTEGLKRIRFIIYTCLVVGVGTTLKISTEPNLNTVLGQFWPLPLFLAIISALVAIIFHIVMSKGLKRLAVMFISAGFFLLTVGFFFLGMEEPDIQHSPTFNFFFPICFFLIGIFIICMEKQFDWSGILRHFIETMIRVRVLSAALAVACSLFYLCATLAAIPARRDIQNATDRYLQIGEVAYFEEKMNSQ